MECREEVISKVHRGDYGRATRLITGRAEAVRWLMALSVITT